MSRPRTGDVSVVGQFENPLPLREVLGEGVGRSHAYRPPASPPNLPSRRSEENRPYYFKLTHYPFLRLCIRPTLDLVITPESRIPRGSEAPHTGPRPLGTARSKPRLGGLQLGWRVKQNSPRGTSSHRRGTWKSPPLGGGGIHAHGVFPGAEKPAWLTRPLKGRFSDQTPGGYSGPQAVPGDVLVSHMAGVAQW